MSFDQKRLVDLPAILSEKQALFVHHMLPILDAVEGVVGSIKIIGCYRTLEKYKSLVAKGYNPSATSDHFWGQSIPMGNKVSSDGVGAVDFTCKDIQKSFYKIRDMDLDIGQLILEKNKTFWLHLSNPKSLIGIKKPVQYKTSLDNGKTFVTISRKSPWPSTLL